MIALLLLASCGGDDAPAPAPVAAIPRDAARPPPDARRGGDDADPTGGLLGFDDGGINPIYGTIGRGTGTGISYGSGRTQPPTVHVTLGEPTVVGELDVKIVTRFLKHDLSRLEYCYEKWLIDRPSLAGTVTAQFFVAPGGDVAMAKADGVDPDVDTCIAGVIKATTFPKRGSGAQVTESVTLSKT